MSLTPEGLRQLAVGAGVAALYAVEPRDRQTYVTIAAKARAQADEDEALYELAKSVLAQGYDSIPAEEVEGPRPEDKLTLKKQRGCFCPEGKCYMVPDAECWEGRK